MKRLLLSGFALAALAIGPATAADMPLKAPILKAPAPVYNWSGCYFGGNVGGKWAAKMSGNINVQDAPGSNSLFDLSGDNSNNGSFIGGGQVGCNLQSGQLVFGIEGDADWQNLNRTGTALPVPPLLAPPGSFSVTSKWQASLRGRLGYAVDRVQWYATGGVGWANLCLDANVTVIVEPNISGCKSAVGATLGAGVEYAIADQVTLGLEGRYTWYGSQNFNAPAVDPLPAPLPATESMNLNTAEIMGKVNWKFGGNDAAGERGQTRR